MVCAVKLLHICIFVNIYIKRDRTPACTLSLDGHGKRGSRDQPIDCRFSLQVVTFVIA
jgi:hypothetical protein